MERIRFQEWKRDTLGSNIQQHGEILSPDLNTCSHVQYLGSQLHYLLKKVLHFSIPVLSVYIFCWCCCCCCCCCGYGCFCCFDGSFAVVVVERCTDFHESGEELGFREDMNSLAAHHVLLDTLFLPSSRKSPHGFAIVLRSGAVAW